MKSGDFTWNKDVRFTSGESLYFNKDRLRSMVRTVNYFENGFLSSAEGSKLNRLTFRDYVSINSIEEMIMSTRLKRRIIAMADYTYDELRYSEPDKTSEIDDEMNIKFNQLCLTLQLITFYSQGIVRQMSGREADAEIVKSYYRIIRELDLCDFIDDCLKEANKRYIEMDSIFEKDDYNEFSYTPSHEYALFDKLLMRNITNTYSFDCKQHLINCLTSTIGTNELNVAHYDPMTNVHRILKNTMMDISSSSIPLENKNKLVKVLTDLADDAMFDEEKQLELMRSALVYTNRRRPTMRCNELFEKNKETYSYKGIVYHGFVNTGTMYNVKHELKEHYKDGFISCSKSLKTASSFAGIADYFDDYEYETNRVPSGYVIEILIDDDVEAIDLESLLVDMYNESKSKYQTLYRSYRKEQEVLLKLPIVSYRLLSHQEVLKRLKEEKKEEKWNKMGEENNTLSEDNKPKPLQTKDFF